jgi:hypothetical protein
MVVLLPLLAGATPPPTKKAATKQAGPDTTEAPAVERDRRNPVVPTEDAMRMARFHWREHCETCHGSKGRGDGPNARLHEARKGAAPRNLTEADVQENLSDGEILWRISKGLIEGDNIIMPAFETKIPSETHRWQLVLFVRTLGKPGAR